MSVYLRTLLYFRAFTRQTLLAVILMAAGIGLNLLKPWPFKYIVDGLLPGDVSHGSAEAKAFIANWFGWTNVPGAVLALCGALVVISLLSGLLNLLSNALLIQIGLKALLHLRTQIYSCLQALPLRFHDARRSTNSTFRVAYDSQSIQTIYNKGFSTIFGSVVTLIGTLVIMFLMDWRLTLVSMAVLPPVVWAIRYYSGRIRRASTTIQERESDLLAIAQEGLGSIRMVQAFGREFFEVEQFVGHATRSLEANFRLNMVSMQSALMVGTLMALGSAVMYGTGSLQVLRGSLSLGDLLVFVAYLTTLYQPVEQLTYTAWALEGAAAGAQRCFEVLDRQEETKDAPDAAAITSAKGQITFEGVSFAYDGKAPVLSSINLQIGPGETVVFVGGTGAGKSTLLSLLPRFYDPTSGIVRLDGYDLKTLTKASLRAQIGIVLQDTLLFSSSIRENIGYSREGATDAEIIEAAKQAQAYDFIMDQPLGFETPVGERGGHLSVGQRQRIGIARAFLKDAPILLLDEPTSALDPATEKAIMKTVAELMRGRTTLVVTHRLATAHHLGRMVLLEDGRIAEQGTGPELLAAGGSYARLYRAAGVRPHRTEKIMKRKKIIVLGFMGACPIAGVVWQHIHYIVGLQRLGHEVYYVEDRSNYPYNPATLNISDNFSYAAQTLWKLASQYGFKGRWAYCARYKQPFALAGMGWEALLKLYQEADCALNICGSHDLNEQVASIRRLIYVESDPGVQQIRIDKGEQDSIDYLRAHRYLFTFGENIGTSAFPVPLHDFTWLATRQPVVTDLWCAAAEAPPPSQTALLTSICNWSTSGKKDIVWRNSNYLWSKSEAFLRFIEAPKRSGELFELATDVASESEHDLFLKNDWKLVLPNDLSADWDGYRDYIRKSKGEFTCAKDQYVRLNTGWFSDRTACYLAAGRPVITQETGFTLHYGGKEGLLSFSTMEEIVEAAASIRADYQRHSRAALAIAREVFEAEKVLGSLLERAGV